MHLRRLIVNFLVLVGVLFGAVVSAVGQDVTPPKPLPGQDILVTPPREAPEKKHYRLPSDDIRAIDEEAGVLTPKGQFTIEPSLRYILSTSDRVVILGYTILPAITVGLIDVQSVDSTTVIGAFAVRYGLTNRIELEFKVPYVYRNDSNTGRELGTGTTRDTIFNADGYGLGDLEFSVRGQLNQPGPQGPFYVGGVRVKANNGKDLFEVPIDNNSGLPTELPVGSGFWSVEPSITMIVPSDPVVFFGSAKYLWNIERTVNGNKIDPGDAIGGNIGLGFALNEKTSISFGFEMNVLGKNEENGQRLGNSKTTYVGSLLFGTSYKLGENSGLNVSLNIGVTEAAPDIDLTVRVPFSL